MKGCQEVIFFGFGGIDMSLLNHFNLLAFAMHVHDISSEFKVREFHGKFVVGHLHVLSMKLQLLLVLVSWVKFLKSTTVLMINKDDFSK